LVSNTAGAIRLLEHSISGDGDWRAASIHLRVLFRKAEFVHVATPSQSLWQ